MKLIVVLCVIGILMFVGYYTQTHRESSKPIFGEKRIVTVGGIGAIDTLKFPEFKETIYVSDHSSTSSWFYFSYNPFTVGEWEYGLTKAKSISALKDINDIELYGSEDKEKKALIFNVGEVFLARRKGKTSPFIALKFLDLERAKNARYGERKATLEYAINTAKYQAVAPKAETLSLQTDFVKSGDLVLDLKTGLEWQDNSEVGGHEKSWQEAKTYCENLKLQGSGNWRLPSKSELFSLVTNGRPTISKNTVFENIGWYSNWSSTIENEHDVWEVNLEYVIGHALDTRLNMVGVRCVKEQ